jgi:hypothetical protein
MPDFPSFDDIGFSVTTRDNGDTRSLRRPLKVCRKQHKVLGKRDEKGFSIVLLSALYLHLKSFCSSVIQCIKFNFWTEVSISFPIKLSNNVLQKYKIIRNYLIQIDSGCNNYENRKKLFLSVGDA